MLWPCSQFAGFVRTNIDTHMRAATRNETKPYQPDAEMQNNRRERDARIPAKLKPCEVRGR